MKYFTSFELLGAVLAYAAFGVACGSLYGSASELFYGIGRIFILPFKICLNKSKKEIISNNSRQKSNGSKVMSNAYDLLFFLIMGIAYILLTYIFLDGVFRIYFLLLLILFFALSYLSLGIASLKAVRFISSALHVALYYLLFPLLYPIRLLGVFLLMLYRPIKNAVTLLIFRMRCALVSKRKFKRAEKVFYLLHG